MSIKVLVDMNLTPDWVRVLARHGWSAVHWSTVGPSGATDRAIMDWAVANGYVVFTHDLDFGTMLALTHATGPSVLQSAGRTSCPATWKAWSWRPFANTNPIWHRGL